MSVITISRQYGSGGDEIAQRICQLTGYHQFNKTLFFKAAVEAGLSNQEVVDYSEEDYKIQNLFERLFGRNRTVAQLRIWQENPDGSRTQAEMPLSEELALSLVQRAVQSAYLAGDVVIVGRGGQMILRDHPGVLQVRIVAPAEERLRRVRAQHRLEDIPGHNMVELRRAAQDIIEQHDAASADYLRRFYDVDWTNPCLYHMVINTGLMELDAAAAMIIEAARQLKSELTPA